MIKKVLKSKFVINSTLVLFTTLLFGATFIAYMYFIGVPKTQARNYYELSLQDIQEGDKDKSFEDLLKASSYWPETYIVQRIEGWKF